MFGFLNIYKPRGITSHDVVAALRRVTKIKQIGHTGTLDPFAEGVLPICIGKATRLIEYLEDDKAYIGTIQLGSSTSTYDTEGKIIKTSSKKVSLFEIEEALQSFRGEIEQIPPIYSAIKVKGKKLYEYAREGQEVKIEPRNVTIYKLEIVNFNQEEAKLKVKIECSKGTYIRSIANDLGEQLGTYGHLISLERIKAGSFLVQDSIKLEEFNSIEKIKENLINPLEKITYTKYELDEIEKNKVSNGNHIIPQKSFQQNQLISLTSKNQLVGISKFENNTLKCQKVFL